MNFHFFSSEENFNEIRFPDVSDWQKWMGHGTSIADIWKPVKLEYIYGVNSKRDKNFDISQCCSPLFTISEKALNILGNMLRRNGDILDILSPKGFYFFHCTNIIDALKENESEITWLDKDKGWIASINPFVLDKKKVKNQEIFRLPNRDFHYTFFCDEFKNLVINNKLKGICFDRYETIIIN